MPNHLQGQKESPFTDFEMAVADPNAMPDHIESRKKNISCFKQMK